MAAVSAKMKDFILNTGIPKMLIVAIKKDDSGQVIKVKLAFVLNSTKESIWISVDNIDVIDFCVSSAEYPICATDGKHSADALKIHSELLSVLRKDVERAAICARTKDMKLGVAMPEMMIVDLNKDDIGQVIKVKLAFVSNSIKQPIWVDVDCLGGLGFGVFSNIDSTWDHDPKHIADALQEQDGLMSSGWKEGLGSKFEEKKGCSSGAVSSHAKKTASKFEEKKGCSSGTGSSLAEKPASFIVLPAELIKVVLEDYRAINVDNLQMKQPLKYDVDSIGMQYANYVLQKKMRVWGKKQVRQHVDFGKLLPELIHEIYERDSYLFYPKERDYVELATQHNIGSSDSPLAKVLGVVHILRWMVKMEKGSGRKVGKHFIKFVPYSHELLDPFLEFLVSYIECFYDRKTDYEKAV